MASKLAQLETMVNESFAAKDEAKVLQVQKAIVKVSEKIGKIRAQFDRCVDLAPQFGVKEDGESFFPNVVRIRKHSDTVGRPKSIKPVDTSLDF